ncbi:unnamed protein product [Porites evermanni]|uniref:C2H2-type domain-containing protein n=1 Tax=Porites evermanni TaxID=104178 RepID=A0ABN8LYE7_9CNID|nr:unnamed protein product [Porites evermanni]
MKRHMKRKHNLNSNNVTSQKGKCLCNECDRQFYRIKDLREHLSPPFQTTKFESWKAEVEEKEGCSFKHLSTGQKVEYFQCNRGGSYRPRRSGKRRQKSQGRCKIEKNCTSSMLLKYEDDGTMTVDVCYTHYGHEIELQHVWLSKTKRQQLVAKMQQGVPRERILNDIREGVTKDQFLREHLVEKKDLFNIQSAFGLKDYQRHQNDLDSVLAWITEWNQSPDTNPILLQNFQDSCLDGYDLPKEDIVLVIQSLFQKSMLEKFGASDVCCDSIHGTNGEVTKELRKKIGGLQTEVEVYKMFRTVLEQTSETLFEESLRGFIRRLSLPSKTASFRKYFEQEWVSRKQEWAYCLRVGLGINTNMFVEAFHKVFKYQYLKGKSNKRLGNLLLNLLKYVRDKTFDRLIKLTKGKVTSRLSVIHERHLRSLTLPTASVEVEEDDTWEVLGQDGISRYKVSKLMSACKEQTASLSALSVESACIFMSAIVRTV